MKEGLANATEFGLKILVDKKSLEERNLVNSDIEPIQSVTEHELKNLIRSADTIINF